MTELEKKIEIEKILSRLSTDEVELLGFKDFKLTPQERGYYIFKASYMIGDADGYDDKVCEVSLNNPFAEIISDVLSALVISFDTAHNKYIHFQDLDNYFMDGEIDKFAYDLLSAMLDGNKTEVIQVLGFESNKENFAFITQFDELVCYEFYEYDSLFYGSMYAFEVK